uniref:Uncharacterized protein n=1 Tax=Solanum lycopersicum TaxID=4081 RepID=A0A3Q7EDL8_SOLLC
MPLQISSLTFKSYSKSVVGTRPKTRGAFRGNNGVVLSNFFVSFEFHFKFVRFQLTGALSIKKFSNFVPPTTKILLEYGDFGCYKKPLSSLFKGRTLET